MLSKTKIRTVTAATAAALCLAACGQDGGGTAQEAAPAPQAAPPPALVADGLARAAGPGAEVKNIMPGGALIEVALPLPKDKGDYAAQGDRLYVDETAILAKHLARAVQDGASDLPAGADKLSLVVLRPDTDRLGKPDAHSFMTLEFAVADLKAAQIKALGAFGVLNLATAVQVVLPWQTAVKPWCAFHNAAPDFCLLARQSVAYDYWDSAPI